MKRVWRIMPALLELRGTSADERSAWMRNAMDIWKTEFSHKSNAEKRAEELARINPGARYEVYEVISAYLVDGLRRETPEDLEAEAKDHFDPPPVVNQARERACCTPGCTPGHRLSDCPDHGAAS